MREPRSRRRSEPGGPAQHGAVVAVATVSVHPPPNATARDIRLLRPWPLRTRGSSAGGPTPLSVTVITTMSSTISTTTTACEAWAWRATLPSASRIDATISVRTSSDSTDVDRALDPQRRREAEHPAGLGDHVGELLTERAAAAGRARA